MNPAGLARKILQDLTRGEPARQSPAAVLYPGIEDLERADDGSDDRRGPAQGGSHTAVAIDTEEEPLGTLRVRASAGQAQRLVAWAAAWPGRTWAVEGASGLGHLLAQQLVAAGERVPGVQLRLGARVRLLATGASNKNNPNDALPVAVAALRSRTRRQVSADDHATVLKVWSRRHRDLGRAKNQVACRLHAVLRPGPWRRARGDHCSSRRPHPPVSHAVRHRRAGPRRARRRAPGGHAPPGCPDPRVEEEAGHRGQGLRTTIPVAPDLPMEQLRMPVMLVSAADDPYKTADVVRYSAPRIPGAKAVILESGGHVLVGQDDRVRKEVQGFLGAQVTNAEPRRG
jgi:pimeloyl-ACP methyl ester carboxylesterase